MVNSVIFKPEAKGGREMRTRKKEVREVIEKMRKLCGKKNELGFSMQETASGVRIYLLNGESFCGSYVAALQEKFGGVTIENEGGEIFIQVI